MTDYTFKTHVKIPEESVIDILADYQSTLLGELGDLELTDKQINAIATKMDKIAAIVCNDAKASVQGYNLTGPQVMEIAAELRYTRKIGAIKAFRQYTGAGLKDAKDFIDGFCIGPLCKAGAVPAIRFAMAFGR